MRIGAVLVRVLLVAGLAAAVASPSFVDRRSPTFEELFERFRANDMTIAYRASSGSGDGYAELAKSGDIYARLTLVIPNDLGGVDRISALVTPKSVTYCLAIGPAAESPPRCFSESPRSADATEPIGKLTPGLAGAYGSDALPSKWSRQDDRTFLGTRSRCFRATPSEYEGLFEVCFDSRGNLLFSKVINRVIGEEEIEATSVEHSVDMSVFDEKKFLNEN